MNDPGVRVGAARDVSARVSLTVTVSSSGAGRKKIQLRIKIIV